MIVAARAVAVAASLLIACAQPAAVGLPGAVLPKTRAEASGYTETSRYADVRVFLDSLRATGAPLNFGVMGQTAGGRDIPYVIASRPQVRTAAEARALTPARPIVYVQGNIHGGEVEGKEALLMLLRDLTFEQRPNILDSVVLIAVPIYNVDGNESFGPQETNRPEQHGPALIGRRPNAAGLDLNRDYMKAVAPETRASLAMFNAWDPDVFVDLHTTNGSFHGYALTYSPPQTPAAPLGERTREWLEVLRQRMRSRRGFETFDYGNFGADATPWQQRAVHTAAVNAWTTFDHRPRFSTNYYGLRGGIAILSEAYSHDPFERRVASTYAFTREILSLAAERAQEITSSRRQAARVGELIAGGTPMPVRARFTTRPDTMEVLVEEVERVSDSVLTEPGLRRGLRRTGRYRNVLMPVYVRFEPTLSTTLPRGYIVPGRLTGLLDLLRAHGIRLQLVGEIADASALFGAGIQEFVVDSVSRSAQPFEQRHQVQVEGSWRPSAGQASAGDYYLPLDQPLGRLAAYLLKPRSDDGVVTWDLLGEEIAPGRALPIFGVPARPGH